MDEKLVTGLDNLKRIFKIAEEYKLQAKSLVETYTTNLNKKFGLC